MLTLNGSGTRGSAYLAVKLLDRDRQWEGEEDGHTWIRHCDKLLPDSNKHKQMPSCWLDFKAPPTAAFFLLRQTV